jgi:hypothetical protein
MYTTNGKYISLFVFLFASVLSSGIEIEFPFSVFASTGERTDTVNEAPSVGRDDNDDDDDDNNDNSRNDNDDDDDDDDNNDNSRNDNDDDDNRQNENEPGIDDLIECIEDQGDQNNGKISKNALDNCYFATYGFETQAPSNNTTPMSAGFG